MFVYFILLALYLKDWCVWFVFFYWMLTLLPPTFFFTDFPTWDVMSGSVTAYLDSGVWTSNSQWEFSEEHSVRELHFDVTHNTLVVSTHCSQLIPSVDSGSFIMWQRFKIQLQRPCPPAATRASRQKLVQLERGDFPMLLLFCFFLCFILKKKHGLQTGAAYLEFFFFLRQKLWQLDQLSVGVASPLPTQDKLVVWWESVKVVLSCKLVCVWGGEWEKQFAVSVQRNRNVAWWAHGGSWSVASYKFSCGGRLLKTFPPWTFVSHDTTQRSANMTGGVPR